MSKPIDATAWILDNLTAIHDNIALQRRQIDEMQTRLLNTELHTLHASQVRPFETTEQGPKCGACGGRQVFVRGRYPGHDNRPVCPQCLAERLDGIRNISSEHYGQAASGELKDS